MYQGKDQDVMVDNLLVKCASNQNENAECRSIPLEKIKQFQFCFPEKFIVSNWLKISNIYGEIGLSRTKEGIFEVMPDFRNILFCAKNELNESKGLKLAKKVSKKCLPAE